MKQRETRRGRSILARMMALLLAVLVAQTGIYLLVFLKGGIVSENEQNAFDAFTERTANRKLYLENEMVSRWANTGEGESQVLRVARAELDAAGPGAALDSKLCQRVISQVAPAVVDMLRRNGVTGVFLVLDCPDAEQNYPGLYVRDYDPVSYNENNADLLMERGLPAVARENSIAMDSYWSAFFRMTDADAENTQFFFRPLEAAKAADAAHRDSRYFYRWSGTFSLSEMDRKVMTYSVPLILEDGTVLGVLGVDITADYLADQLRYTDLGEERTGVYVLGRSTDGGSTYTPVCFSGPSYGVWFGQPDVLAVHATRDDGIVTLAGKGGRTLYGSVQPIKLYNSNTPFAGEQWALIGILDSEKLMSFTRHIMSLLVLSAAGSLLLGLVLVYLAARSVANPITGLVAKLKKSDPDKPIHLGRIHTDEIDALTEAVENLSNAAAESAARVSKIITLIDIPIGVFEYSRDSTRVFCSENLFSILNWPGRQGDGWLSAAEFRAQMSAFGLAIYDREENIYRLPQSDRGERWIQLFYTREGDTEDRAVLGAIQDVTRDVESKQKMKHERDFDILTGLYNRRALDERAVALLRPEQQQTLGVAALLMFDLDNLKYVNDSYGHDYGDSYIQAFADSLSYFKCCNSVVGRRSGDEFNVFLYGCASRDEARTLVDRFWDEAAQTYLTLPEGKRIRVRASGGLAWYPEDADSYDELLRMADFAMYTSKHTVRGEIQELNRTEYAERGILIHGQEDLNCLIENRLVRYAFQPIVSAADGHLCGYELLMRPQVRQLSDLGALFRLAKDQSKLYQMEQLTWFEAMEAYHQAVLTGAIPEGVLAFINSIGGQSLTAADLAALRERHSAILNRVVLELTESELSTDEMIVRKRGIIYDWGGLVALDDYGSGYNSESVLLRVRPDIVKIDISIIRGVDGDESKRAILRNVVAYCGQRGIHTLAEGVETRAELETVIRLGVDYLQGFYLGYPQFEPKTILAERAAEICSIYQSR